MPIKIPDLIAGKITLQIALKGLHPRSTAASYRLLSISDNFGKTLNTTYGIQKKICDNSKLVKPNSEKIIEKTIIKVTPVTISAFIIGTLFKRIILWRFFLDKEWIPKAKITPKIVEIKVDKIVIVKVFRIAFCKSLAFWISFPVKKVSGEINPPYHLKENSVKISLFLQQLAYILK